MWWRLNEGYPCTSFLKSQVTWMNFIVLITKRTEVRLPQSLVNTDAPATKIDSTIMKLSGTDKLTFTALGDWGAEGSRQRQVAKALGDWSEKHQSAFTMAIGEFHIIPANDWPADSDHRRERRRSRGLMGGGCAWVYGPNNPGSIIGFCSTLGFLPCWTEIVTLNKGGSPIQCQLGGANHVKQGNLILDIVRTIFMSRVFILYYVWPISATYLGDNFYSFGVSSADDSKFKTTWKDVYTHKSLQHPWLAIEGNHDYMLGKCSDTISRNP